MTGPPPGTDSSPDATATLRYRAFISYSHRDSRLVQRLHRRLESYSVPRALRGTDTGASAIPANLRPVFRDRDELASASRLSDTIEAALDQSQSLVVVCSPAAVSSQWVNAEILYFRIRHPDRPVFAFVAAGDPGLDPRTSPASASLPLALALEDPGQPDGRLGEPVAADAREAGDGFSAACLKLIAGLLGVRYDQLRQREQRRSQLRWALVGVASLAVSAIFAFLAWQATVARDQARAAQAQAELELESEQQTRAFLLSVFELADANENRGNQVTVREVLDQAVERIDRTSFNRPVVRSRFLATMGQAYASLGLNRRSTELLVHSISGLGDQPLQGSDRDQRIDSRLELSEVFYDMGQYEDALAQFKAIEKTGDPLTPRQRVRAANLRGNIETQLGNDNAAALAFESALSLLEGAAMGREEATFARTASLYGLAKLDSYAGRHEKAETGFAEAQKLLLPVAGERHPLYISLVTSRGSNAYSGGRRAAARQQWQAALASASKVYDRLNPVIGTLSNNLGLLMLEDGDLVSAETALKAALASDRQHRGEAFDDLAYPLANLAYVRFFQGDTDESEALLMEALPIALEHDHAMKGAIQNGLADIQCTGRRHEAGLSLAKASVAESLKRQDPGHWRIAQAKLTLAYCQLIAGESVDRVEMSRQAAIIRKKFGARSPFTRRADAQAQASGPVSPQ